MRARLAGTTLAALLLAALAAGPGASAGARDVIERGSCSGASTWKLKLSPEDGGIEVEFEVDQGAIGEAWRVRILHDGELAFRGRRTTRGSSGSFEVRIVEPDRAGTDRFVGRARNLASDERCRGAATI